MDILYLFDFQIDKILLNEKLAVYSDYVWFAKFYKSKLAKKEIINFTDIFQATNSKINDKKDNTLMLNNLGSENKTEIENQNDKKGISILVEETNKNGKPK